MGVFEIRELISKVCPLIIPELHRVLEFEKWIEFRSIFTFVYYGNSVPDIFALVPSVLKMFLVTFVLMSSNFLPWVRIKSKKVDESNDFSCSLSVLPHRLKNCVTWNHNCFVPNFDKIRSTPHPSFIATCSRKAYLNVPMFGWGVSIFFKYRVLSKELTILFNRTQQELLNANFVL